MDKKRKMSYKETFKKGSMLDPAGVAHLHKCLRQKGTEVHLLEKGLLSDDTGFVTIRLEGFK